ncbi:BMP family ABC transporter substrate-binding protein [Pelomonas sp. KK5]|uniref:BMP family ABC transporter substrate-binding protein n=1 Tax=Pelomonas sp. KK5 TaxID=1855730 RepID=UPI00097C25C1|nr:BMP family ABC transporter substrate-binding protein [Pelomonas sp. KK5]
MTDTSRRGFLIQSAAVAGAGFLPAAQAANELVVGVVYVGAKDDLGWNNAHAGAIQVLKSVPGVKVVQEERVPETKAVVSTMESMIQQDGARLILGTSFGYFNPFMVDLARKYPNVEFRHPTTLWDRNKHPANLGSYFCFIDQAHYIDGVAAGLSTKSNKLGYIAAKPIPLVLRTINAFLLGARSVNPNATVQLVFTGDWSAPVREAEAANALVDAGCDVIASHVDSPKVIVATAERRGAKSCGHNCSQAGLAPKGFITGAELKYETIYKAYAADLQQGRKLPNMLTGGYDADMVANTAFGAGASEQARNAALAAVKALKAGKPMYAGPLKDNTGKVVIPAGIGNYDPSLDGMNYLLDGVVGSII